MSHFGPLHLSAPNSSKKVNFYFPGLPKKNRPRPHRSIRCYAHVKNACKRAVIWRQSKFVKRKHTFSADLDETFFSRERGLSVGWLHDLLIAAKIGGFSGSGCIE